MSTSRVIEAVDVFEDRHLSLSASFPGAPPDQFGLDGFEERLDGRIVITIAFAAHRDPEAVLAQDLLIVV